MTIPPNTFLLDKDCYTWKNAFCWGYFISHCEKVKEGTLASRIVHLLLASSQLLPIVGQICSIFEKIFFDLYTTSWRRSDQTDSTSKKPEIDLLGKPDAASTHQKETLTKVNKVLSNTVEEKKLQSGDEEEEEFYDCSDKLPGLTSPPTSPHEEHVNGNVASHAKSFDRKNEMDETTPRQKTSCCMS